MSNLSQFFGGGGLKPTLKASSLGVANGQGVSLSSIYPLIATQTAGVTANTLTTALSRTGKGALGCFFLQSVDGTSRTHRIKITLDGTVIYDKTSPEVTTALAILPVQGQIAWSSATTAAGVIENPILFESSLLIEYASSLTETAKTNFGYTYYGR